MTSNQQPNQTTETIIKESQYVSSSTTEKIQPQPYPLQGQALSTGWGHYPQGAYYPPPVQKPQEIIEEVIVNAPTTTTTTTTTEYVDVETIPVSTPIIIPATTSYVGPMSYIVGPNTQGVPENFPYLQSDAGCHKCHGTGYKKKLLTRKWAPCKKCAKKFGTDVKAVDLNHLNSGHYTSGYGSTTYGTGVGYGTTEYVTEYVATPVIVPAATTTTTVTSSAIGSTGSHVLPAGFQTIPASSSCIKC